jgi:hypothetical protein
MFFIKLIYIKFINLLIMYHIINKLLLIDNIRLITDIVRLMKEIYIRCSAIIILPPSPQEWFNGKAYDEEKIHFYMKKQDIHFRNFIGNNSWNWSICINYHYDKKYDIVYRNDICIITNFEKSYINCDNIWYDKKLFYRDEDNDDCCNDIVPIYYFPPN